jgi:hypothetical protein
MAADASKDAAAAGAAGQAAAGATTQAAADRARQDVNRLFPSAQQDLLAGQSSAFDIVGQGITEQQRLLGAGNMNAQQTTGQGFGQVQNALMGLPVNQQNFAPQGIAQSQIPYNPISGQAVPALGAAPQQGQQPLSGIFSNLGQQAEQRKADALSGMSSNRDLFSAVGTGELNIPGIDERFWQAISEGTRGGRTKWGKKGNTFFDSNSIAEAVTPAQQQAIVDNSGFKKEERQKLALLMREYQKLRGTA